MPKAKNGVDYYLIGKIETEVYFPDGEQKCQYCKFCRAEGDLKRFWCRMTDKMIYNPFAVGLPEFCPAQITGEIRGQIVGDLNERKKGDK